MRFEEPGGKPNGTDGTTIAARAKFAPAITGGVPADEAMALFRKKAG